MEGSQYDKQQGELRLTLEYHAVRRTKITVNCQEGIADVVKGQPILPRQRGLWAAIQLNQSTRLSLNSSPHLLLRAYQQHHITKPIDHTFRYSSDLSAAGCVRVCLILELINGKGIWWQRPQHAGGACAWSNVWCITRALSLSDVRSGMASGCALTQM